MIRAVSVPMAKNAYVDGSGTGVMGVSSSALVGVLCLQDRIVSETRKRKRVRRMRIVALTAL